MIFNDFEAVEGLGVQAPASGKSAALAELAAALGREQRYEESVRRGLEALDLAEEAKDRKGKGCCLYIVARRCSFPMA